MKMPPRILLLPEKNNIRCLTVAVPLMEDYRRKDVGLNLFLLQ
jgi:hypothetical protein